ncbi:hypothetical protein LTR53_000646 [Teratosphaeriaceae sp. CCFEE 6253]|nr:hypothetical protein LTR53_000646 [Teratosphaeriaceae sp. CCFEE 6253]
MSTNATGDVVICDSTICSHCNTARHDPDRRSAVPFMSMYHGYPFVHTTNMEAQGEVRVSFMRFKDTALDTALLAPARPATASDFAIDGVVVRDVPNMQRRANDFSYCSPAPKDGPIESAVAALTIEDDMEKT